MKTLITALCLSLAMSTASAATAAKPVTIGIVAPVAIPAMTEIVNGFKEELSKKYRGKITYVVQNAQGDMNIQRTILQQFKAKNVTIVVPIGTAAAQMANSINTSQPIVALAAEFTDPDRAKFKNKNITNILDEIDISKQVQFIHAAFPQVKKLTLIYSPDDRIFAQVQQANAAGKQYGITFQKLMIQSLPDLYTVSRLIDKDSQGIFILKDETIVSGINTLVKQAAQKQLLLIASDDGSVQKGADFAVGVSEKMIGSGGADLAAQVLAGTPAGQIPVMIMTKYHVYASPQYETGTRLNKDVAFANVKAAAAKFDYPVETLAQISN